MTNELMPITAKDMQMQVNAIQEMMKQVMIEDTHFGKVPGCGDKPALLKPGAEKIGLMFGLAPSFQIKERQQDHGHREYKIVCTLKSRSGMEVGQGVGCCSTMESKYRYRGTRVIGTGMPVPAEYWKSKDPSLLGGKNFVAHKIDGRWEICERGERKENPDIADTYNTVLKIAKKRAHIDAIITATAASDIFTQDIDDLEDGDATPVQKKAAPKPPAQQGQGGVYRYNIPYDDSQRLKPRSKGLEYDKASKQWFGKEVEEFLEYLVLPDAGEESGFNPDAYGV